MVAVYCPRTVLLDLSISHLLVHSAQMSRGKSGAGLQVDVFTPFSALLQHLWALWEMMLLAEPLLVVAPSPGEQPLPPPLPLNSITPSSQTKHCLPTPTLHLHELHFVMLLSHLFGFVCS